MCKYGVWRSNNTTTSTSKLTRFLCGRSLFSSELHASHPEPHVTLFIFTARVWMLVRNRKCMLFHDHLSIFYRYLVVDCSFTLLLVFIIISVCAVLLLLLPYSGILIIFRRIFEMVNAFTAQSRAHLNSLTVFCVGYFALHINTCAYKHSLAEYNQMNFIWLVLKQKSNDEKKTNSAKVAIPIEHTVEHFLSYQICQHWFTSDITRFDLLPN